MAIAIVQDGAITSDTGSAATLTAVFDGPVAAGSLVIAVTEIPSDISVTGFSDGTNNGSQAAAKFNALGGAYEIWCIPNHPGGEDTFTVTWASAEAFRCIAIVEVSGAAASSPQEGSAADDDNGTAASSGNLSPNPSVDGALIIVHGYFNSDPTWGGSFATVPGITRDGNTNELVGYRIQPTAGAIAATWTQTSGVWVAQAASFLPGGNSAVVTGTLTDNANEGHVRAGGKTIVITLSGDTWAPA